MSVPFRCVGSIVIFAVDHFTYPAPL